MAESLQKWVGRNRPPLVQITCDVKIGDAIEKRELPLLVGELADLAGKPASAHHQPEHRAATRIATARASPEASQLGGCAADR